MHKSKLISIILVFSALILSVVLNPSPDQHRDKIKQVIAERSQIEGILGIGQLTAFASRYKSVGVASYTTLNNKVISFGIFGMVFVSD